MTNLLSSAQHHCPPLDSLTFIVCYDNDAENRKIYFFAFILFTQITRSGVRSMQR